MEEMYKVVKIIDSKNIVINAGKENYIKKGDKFEIYIKGEEVKDLDGKTSLGTLDTIKDTLTVITVFPKMCVCQKLIKSAIPSITGLLNEPTSTSLNVNENEISGGFSSDLTIKVGDFARLTE